MPLLINNQFGLSLTNTAAVVGGGGDPGGGGGGSPSAFVCPSGDVSFTFISRESSVNAHQYVTLADDEYWVAGHPTSGEQQWYIQIFDRFWNYKGQVDTRLYGTAGHKQISGLYYDSANDLIYASANNYPTTPELGWIYTINRTARTLNTSYALTGEWTEGITRYNSKWWAVNATAHQIIEYNDTFSSQTVHNLSGTDPGGLYWQGIIEVDDIFYLNAHDGAAGGPLIRAFDPNASPTMNEVSTSAAPPTTTCTQGMRKEGCRTVVWAERDTTRNAVRSTLRDGLTLDAIPVYTGRVGTTFAGFDLNAYNGVHPLTFSVADGSLPPGLSISGSPTGIFGTPTTEGSYTFTLQVTDDAANTAYLEEMTINIFPSSLSGISISVPAQAEPVYGMVLLVDLSYAPAAFWSSVDADGGNIRARGGDGTSTYELPLHVIRIDNGSPQDGWIAIRTDLSADHATIIKLALDGGGLRAAGDTNGQHDVWSDFTCVLLLNGNLTDSSPNSNSLTVNVGSATYGGLADGPGTGLDTSSADFQAIKALAAAHTYPLTMFCSARRVTETSSNQQVMATNANTSGGGNRISLGETNATSKWSIFDGAFDDSAVSSTLNTNATMHAVIVAGALGPGGDDRHYVNGANANDWDAPNLNDKDNLILGDSSSTTSRFRGHIGMAYWGSFYCNPTRAQVENDMLQDQAGLITWASS